MGARCREKAHSFYVSVEEIYLNVNIIHRSGRKINVWEITVWDVLTFGDKAGLRGFGVIRSFSRKVMSQTVMTGPCLVMDTPST